jgi:predicted alpha/beta superfamily hydrolase
MLTSFRRLFPLLMAFLLALAACKPSALPPAGTPRPSTARPGVHVLAQPLAMPGLGRERTLRLYLPPSYEANPARRYPVLYMHDAQNLFDDRTSFAGEWGVDETLDDFAATRGFEAIVVGIDNGGTERIRELAPWTNPKYGAAQGERYMAFVVDTVKPWIDAHYRTQPGRESTAIMGSSMGGLISHYALLRYPQVFGKAAIFSPSYWFTGDVYAQTAAHPWPAGTKTFFYIGGREDAESVPDVERMVALLRTQPRVPGDITVRIDPRGEHDERAWRAQFPHAVAWLFDLPVPGAAAP